MKEDKIVATVQQTMDYDKFKILYGNREILEPRVNKIKKSMQKKVIRNPIIVNENMEIIDGQGRFTALKQMGLPIEYIIVPHIGMDECHLMNQLQTNWTTMDYIKSHAKQGNQNFVLLLKAIADSKSRYGYCATDVLRAANKSGKDKSENGTGDKIRSGTLVYTENDYSKSIKMLKMVDEIAEILCLEKVTTQFLAALINAFNEEGYNHERMKKNLAKNRNNFVITSTSAEQAREITRVYNYRAKAGLIYFEDYYRNKGRNVRTY